MRIGWISGPDEFINKFQLLQEMTSQFPSGLSQSAFMGLLNHWGEEGLDKHLRMIQSHYRSQRDIMLESINNHFKSDEISYTIPTGGMFIWIDFLNKSNLNKIPPSDILFKSLASEGVITVPGGDFFCQDLNCGEKVDPSSIRLTFAAANANEIKEGINRIANGINKIREE